MDNDNKELLEATVKGLQDKIGSLNMELKDKQKELEDANKPVISSTVMDVVNDAINYAVENYNFDNVDSYELEFSLDYDSRIQAETINLTDTYELVEAIVTNVEKQFKIEQDEETND
jgi:predicted unusual protein kinase regulating ubiquinone biosynthesis (AarF/ABC1/UbiB family)